MAVRPRIHEGCALVAAFLLNATACSGPDDVFPDGSLPPCSVESADAGDVTPTSNFVTRSGPTLLLDGAPFRFAGANIYWLGLDENVDGIAAPTTFRVEDALDTAVIMGANVVRSISLGVSVGCSACVEPALSVFDDAAFEPIDHAIYEAGQRGLRLVIPLMDNYRYFSGGRFVFTDWRGLTSTSCGLTCPNGDAFFTDANVIADYEAYIDHVLSHVNVYTGLTYSDDPAIMAWETCNEPQMRSMPYGDAMIAWTTTIAAFIKQRAPRQLVVDGDVESDRSAASFAIPNVDLYTGHYYPMNSTSARTAAQRAIAAGRPFFVGEFDWINHDGGERLDDFLGAIETSDEISGDLFWSLFPHLDSHGYEQHADGYTLHYPGDTYDVRVRAALLRNHAFAMTDRQPPSVTVATSPVITDLSLTGSGRVQLSWRGAAGALTYSIEASSLGDAGPWTDVCAGCATDDQTPWIDPLGTASPSEWYRVVGISPCGTLGPGSAAMRIAQ